ncbi:MAG: response regulator [Myxococcaceae bacterium]|nr:response regulator [Myxococcaceae bacterium]
MRATVLIVDDEAPLLRAMSRLLGKTFEVQSASCAAEALGALTDATRVVLTDFSMPDGDGLTLARSLRERGFKGTIAVLSAVTESDELQAALKAGRVDELISKPWKSDQLVERVRVLCDRFPMVEEDPVGAVRPVAA